MVHLAIDSKHCRNLRFNNSQFLQIKAAAAVAKMLGRTLVMPQLWCGLENLWFAHKGRIWDGMEYPLPAPCTMGQLFHIDMYAHE